MPTTTTPPILLDATQSGTADDLRITLDFDTAMAAGSGTLYVTDGAVQTVIDRATGLPTMRIVGATDTHAVSASDLTFDGDQVTFDVAGLLAGHTYSVVMGAGVLTSSGLAAYGGVRDTATVQFTAPEPDTGPALTWSASDGDLLQSGGALAVTLTFSEAVASLDADALSATNATVAGLATLDGGLTWVVTLAPPSDAIDVTGNTLAIDMSKVTDSAGHAGSGIATVATYEVDTIVNGHVTTFDVGHDNGPSNTDGVTNSQYISFTGALAGDVAYGQYVEIDAVGTDGAHHVFYAYPEQNASDWSEYDDASLADGTYMVTARLVGDQYDDDSDTSVEHASVPVTRQITIDTVAPELAVPVAAEVDARGPLVLNFSEAVYWTDNGDNGLWLLDTTTQQAIRISLTAANFSADHKTITLTPNQLQLVAGQDYQLHLDTLTDLAGNAVDGTAGFQATGTYTDTTPPTAISATSFDGGAHGAGSEITIRVAFDETVHVVNGALPDLALDNGAVAVYDAQDSDASTLVFRYVVAAGDGNTDKLGIADPAALAGHVADATGNVLDTAHIGYAQLTAADGYGHALDVAIDTVAPDAPGTPHLDAGSDSGNQGDGITIEFYPAIAGSGAEAGARIDLYDGDRGIGSTTVRADGTWLVDASLYDTGTYTLHATQTDAAGNTSANSADYTLTIADRPPQPGAPQLDAASDSGDSDNDGITNVTTPTLHGVAEQGGGQMEVWDGDRLLGTTAVDDAGAWQFTVPANAALGELDHALAVRQIDANGDASFWSPVTNVSIDTAAPTADAGTVTETGGTHHLLLTFDEAIEFTQGSITVVDPETNAVRATFLPFSSNNFTIASPDGGLSYVLDLDVGWQPGTVELHIDGGALHDAAGNVAIVGTTTYYLPAIQA